MLNIKKYKLKKAFIDPVKNLSITYKQLSLINEQISKKIKKKSVTLMLTDNDFYCYPMYVALFNSKTILILLDYNLFKEEISNLSKSFNANYLVLNSNIKIKSNVKKIFSYGNFSVYQTKKKFLNTNLTNKLLISTSGTSQKPKFVRLSKKNILNNTKNIIDNLKINYQDTTITTLPIAYSYGLSILNTHLMVGSKIIINSFSIYEKNFWDLIKNYKIKSFGAVPFMYENFIKYSLNFLNKSNLNYISLAGGHLDIELLRILGATCKLNNISFIKMYGQTEASPRISHLEWKNFFSKILSVGKPLKGYKIFIKKKKDSKIGEINLKGKNVFLGYAKNLKDLFKGNDNKYLLNTGDYGFLDSDGYLYISGRKKNFFKIFGKRINIHALKNTLKKEKVICDFKNLNNKLIINISKNKNKISDLKIKVIVSELTKLNKNFIYVSKKKLINYRFK
jgi:long-chain acyl-CoA synthetase